MLDEVGIGACQQQAVLRAVRTRRPDFLAIDDPAIAAQLGFGDRTGQIRATTRLAEELTPGVFASQYGAQILLFLRIVAVHKNGVRCQPTGAGLSHTYRAVVGKHLRYHVGLFLGEIAPVVFLRPGRCGPTTCNQYLAPLRQWTIRIPVLIQPCGHRITNLIIRHRSPRLRFPCVAPSFHDASLKYPEKPLNSLRV